MALNKGNAAQAHTQHQRSEPKQVREEEGMEIKGKFTQELADRAIQQQLNKEEGIVL